MGVRASAKEIERLEQQARASGGKVGSTARFAVKAPPLLPPAERTGLVEPVFFIEPIPIKTPNPLNGSHGSPFATARRAREQVEATQIALLQRAPFRAALAAGCRITLTRCCAGKLADDALPGALKHIRDAVAQWLLGGEIGQLDDDPRLEWVYRQQKAKRGVHVVLLGLETR